MAHTLDSGGFFTFLVALGHSAAGRSQEHGLFWPRFTFFPQFVSECANGNPQLIGKI